MLKRKNFLPQLIQIIFNIIARVYSMYKVFRIDVWSVEIIFKFRFTRRIERIQRD